MPSPPVVSAVPFAPTTFAPSPFAATQFGGGAGIRVGGVVGFGHNPRFHVGFGSGRGRSCFRCGNTGPIYYYSAVPVAGYYPADYSQSYVDEPPSAYVVAHGENAYPAVYQQGANDRKIQELSNEVARLRSEIDSRDNSTYPDRVAHTQPSPQELPTNVTLVLANGRRMQIHNYAIVGQTIWILDEKAANKLSLSQINLPATKLANEDNGVMFLLPGLK